MESVGVNSYQLKKIAMKKENLFDRKWGRNLNKNGEEIVKKQKKTRGSSQGVNDG